MRFVGLCCRYEVEIVDRRCEFVCECLGMTLYLNEGAGFRL